MPSPREPSSSPWPPAFPPDVSVVLAGDAPALPVIATAIHDGHRLPPSVAARMRLADAERLREEDPFTGELIGELPDRIIVHRSRFACDLNRPRAASLYRRPEDAWGLALWHAPPDATLLAEAHGWHDAFYRALGGLLDALARRYPAFVLLDVHSYNHRRDGPAAPATPAHRAPDINIGTASMPAGRWDAVVAAVHDRVRATTLPDGRTPTVANDVAFQGRGALTRFVHERHPQQGCALAIEVRKFFMDEWTGAPDRAVIAALRTMFRRLAEDLTGLLGR